MAVEELGETTLGQLAQHLELDNSTLSRTVEGLVQNGLVKRSVHPTDRRATLLGLTEQGKATCNAINESSDNYYAGVLELIPAGEREPVLEKFTLFVDAFVRHEQRHKASTGCCGEDEE
jgi:DNA-binding MarR family transcriptional regulator